MDETRGVREETADVEALRTEVAQLQTALDARIVIEQAKGVLAERYDLGIREAFELLRYAARSARMPLRELAGEVAERKGTPIPIRLGVARMQRLRAASQRERSEAEIARARQQRERLRRIVAGEVPPAEPESRDDEPA